MSVLDISGAHSTSRLLCRQDAVRYVNFFGGSPHTWGNSTYYYSRDGSRLGTSLIRQTWNDIGPGNASGTVPHHSVSEMSYLREVFLREPTPGNFEIERAYTFSSPGKTSFITSISTTASAPSGSPNYLFPDSISADAMMHPQRISSLDPTDIAWWIKPGQYDMDTSFDYRVLTWSAPGVASGRSITIKSSAYATLNNANIRHYSHYTYGHSGGSGTASHPDVVKIHNYPHAIMYMLCPYYISYDNTTSLGLLCSDGVTLTRNWP